MTDFKQYALKAVQELETRGWRRNSLGYNPGYVSPFEPDVVYRLGDENCKVCALGAAGAAWYDNPQYGYNYDAPSAKPARLDPRYDDFIDRLAGIVAPGWDGELREPCDCGCEDGLREARFDSASDAVAWWNDDVASSKEEVIAAFRKLADEQ